ncbi:MAG TPA: amidohydrolase [Thermoanaerobaculia bacterium]|nr:amidohydrolase [Thermoanaerobaculia bacterium]
MISKLSLGCALAGALLGTLRPSLPEDSADLILVHGVLYPVAPPGRVVGSIAVRGGRIVYLGEDAGALALRGPATQVIELAGRAVTPGLIDAHSHLGGLGAALDQVDLGGAATYEEVIRRVRLAAGSAGGAGGAGGAGAGGSGTPGGRPPGAWIFGRGWDQNRWPDKSFPDHHALSQALPDHPVWLTRVDGHAALLNARAMAALGIDATTADPPGGRLLRNAAGQPTGVLVDRAMDRARLPEATLADRERQLAAAARHCVALGLTTVTDMGIGQRDYEAYSALRRAGRLPLRAALFIADDPETLARWFERGPEIDPAARITVRGVKMYADGALGSRGAALLAPYSDDPGNVGLLVTTGDHLEAVARQAAAHGFQVAIHAIGDRGGMVALDAMERALGGPRPQLRFRLEHAQVLRLEDIQRLARLGIVASMQPTHATSDMPWAKDRLGEARLAGAYAWRKVLNAGGRLALGSDFPVESADPRLGFYAAVTRQDLNGQPPGGWLPGERLSREEALRGFTLDAAWSLFLDSEVGSLAAGKRADLVVFGSDPMTVPAAEIPKAPVDLTLVDGQVVYRRAEVAR